MWVRTLKEAREGRYNDLDHELAKWEDEGGQLAPQSNQYRLSEGQKVGR